MVQGMFGMDLTDKEAGSRLGFMTEVGSELFGKGIGNGFRLGVGFATESNRLVRRDRSGFTRQGFEDGK